jgi:20S proteasome subunit beta 5
MLQPAETLGNIAQGTDETGKNLKIKFDHGTTTLGFRYQGGIILAVDSRATGGQFIGKAHCTSQLIN